MNIFEKAIISKNGCYHIGSAIFFLQQCAICATIEYLIKMEGIHLDKFLSIV